MKRSTEYFTSSAVTSRPFTGGLLWNFTPLRRVNTSVVGFLYSHFSARSGTIVKSAGGFCSGPGGERTSWLETKLDHEGGRKLPDRLGARFGASRSAKRSTPP